MATFVSTAFLSSGKDTVCFSSEGGRLRSHVVMLSPHVLELNQYFEDNLFEETEQLFSQLICEGEMEKLLPLNVGRNILKS